MLGFDAISSLPIADDGIAAASVTQKISAVLRGGQRFAGANIGGGTSIKPAIRGTTRIRVK